MSRGRVAWLLIALLHVSSLPGLCEEIFLRDRGPHPTESMLARLPCRVLSKHKTLRADLHALFTAYPEHCIGIGIGQSDRVFLLMADRSRHLYDDGLRKTHREKLDSPDLQDMLEQPYPAGAPVSRPATDFDPGRIRVEPFFKALYGKSEEEVKRSLTAIRCGKTVFQITRSARADERFREAASRLEALLGRKPELAVYVDSSAGSFKWRNIAGTSRLSPHSFGIAVDLSPGRGPYWRWGSLDENWAGNPKFSFPMEIVDILEKSFFIWGGRWHHYDFMHFEYRPELFLKLPVRDS